MKRLFQLILFPLILLTTQMQADMVASEEDPTVSTPYPPESREGWLGTLGLGVHSTSFNILHTTNDPKGRTGMVSSVKLGYNFTEQLGIHYVRNAAWYKQHNDRYISGISGLGGTYYFLPEQETWYVSTAIGIGDYANLSSSESLTGFAFMATLGYEFSPHWQAEASWMKTSVDNSDNNTLKNSSLQLILNYSWYNY